MTLKSCGGFRCQCDVGYFFFVALCSEGGHVAKVHNVLTGSGRDLQDTAPSGVRELAQIGYMCKDGHFFNAEKAPGVIFTIISLLAVFSVFNADTFLFGPV